MRVETLEDLMDALVEDVYKKKKTEEKKKDDEVINVDAITDAFNKLPMDKQGTAMAILFAFGDELAQTALIMQMLMSKTPDAIYCINAIFAALMEGANLDYKLQVVKS